MITRRGQTLVLFALTMLLLTVMVAMTLSFANRAKQKAELQTIADAAAYTQAIETARTYNSVSLLNRASISHWVAMAGVQALTAYGTMAGEFMGTWGEMAYTFQRPIVGKLCYMQDGVGSSDPHYQPDCALAWLACPSGCPADCTARTSTTRAAAYEFWHAHYSLYSPPADPADDVNEYCEGDGKTPGCTHVRTLPGGVTTNGSGDRFSPGQGQLDAEVADQEKSIRSAVRNLGTLSDAIYDKLEDHIDTHVNTDRIINRALGPDLSPDVHVYMSARQQAKDNVEHVSVEKAEDKNDKALLQAVLGSIGESFPVTLGWKPSPQVYWFRDRIQSNLAATHPSENWKFTVEPDTFRGCAAFTDSTSRSAIETAECSESYYDGFNAATGAAKAEITAEYDDPCTSSWHRSRTWPVAVMIRSTVSSPYNHASHSGSIDWFNGDAVVGGCHGHHGYWDIIAQDEHAVGPEGHTNANLLLGGIAYIFPSGYTTNGLNGQPKLPVVLGRSYPASTRDPWDLNVGFKLTSVGARTDLTRNLFSGEPDRTGVLANGLAYYHRRGYWQEPANLLNPFWHATLVPSDIDHGAGDDTRTILDDTTHFATAGSIYQKMESASPRFQGAQ